MLESALLKKFRVLSADRSKVYEMAPVWSAAAVAHCGCTSTFLSCNPNLAGKVIDEIDNIQPYGGTPYSALSITVFPKKSLNYCTGTKLVYGNQVTPYEWEKMQFSSGDTSVLRTCMCTLRSRSCSVQAQTHS